MNWLRRRWIWIVLAAIAVLVIVASGLLVVYLVLGRNQPNVEVWKDPLAAVAPEQISAAWALYPLAGASVLETIDAATDNGELRTAYATLVFSPDVDDRQRVGRLSMLADSLARGAEPGLASVCYQQIYDLALLSPRLSDPMRADALRTAGDGWAKLGQKDRASAAYDQAYRLAAEGSHLHTAQRRELLGILYSAYVGLGDGVRAEEVRSRIVRLDQQPEAETGSASVEWPELPSGDNAISSSEIGLLEEARREASYAVVNLLSQGLEVSPELVSELAEALKAEDAAKLDWYRQQLESTTQPSKRIDLEWQAIHWLLLKYRVAKRGFGLSLVPEWEADLQGIQLELGTAYENLLYAYEDLVTGLPDAALMTPGRYEALCLVILAGRLGFYPNYPADQLAGDLRSTVTELVVAGDSGVLYVDVPEPENALGLSLRPGVDFVEP